MEEIVKSYRLNQDGSRTAVGTYVRNSKWPEGTDDLYIVGINNWIINSNGEFLVQQRAYTKPNNPGKWSSTNGLVQLEEEGIYVQCFHRQYSIDAVPRETEEELGIKIGNNPIVLCKESQIAGEHLVVDIYVTCMDVDINDIVVDKKEVNEVRFVSLKDLMDLDISTTCSYIRKLAPELLEIAKNNKKNTRVI